MYNMAGTAMTPKLVLFPTIPQMFKSNTMEEREKVPVFTNNVHQSLHRLRARANYKVC